MHKGRLFKAARVLAGLSLAEASEQAGVAAGDIERLEGLDLWPVGSAALEASLARAFLAAGVEIDEDAPGLHFVGAWDEGIPAEALTAQNDG